MRLYDAVLAFSFMLLALSAAFMAWSFNKLVVAFLKL